MSNLASLPERLRRANILQPHCRAIMIDRFHPKESRQVHISNLRAKLRRTDEDLHQLRCEISRQLYLIVLQEILHWRFNSPYVMRDGCWIWARIPWMRHWRLPSGLNG